MGLRIAEATVCDGKFSHKHTYLPEVWRRRRTYLKTSRLAQAVGPGGEVFGYVPAFTVLPVSKAGPTPPAKRRCWSSRRSPGKMTYRLN